MRFQLAPDFWIEMAEKRMRRTVSISRELFALSEVDSQVEKAFVKEWKDKVEARIGAGDEDSELFEQLADLDAEFLDIERDRNEVGRLCLVYMEKELRAILRHLLQRYDKTEVQDNLWTVKRKYLQKFGIRFEKAPIPWQHVIELHLARNCILHNDSRPNEDYIKHKDAKLLVDKEIVVDREGFEHCTRVFLQFLGFVVNSVAVKRGLRKR